MRIFQMYCKYVRKQDEHDTFRGTDKTLKSLINCPWRVLFYLDYKQSILVELCKNSYFSKEKRTIEIGIPLKDEKNFS